MTTRSNVIIIHPDLGIGGAERLIIDVAVALQNRGHRVTVYTSHRDETHCFEEARDGTLDVRVRGNTIFPPRLLGRLHLLMAILRQLHLTVSLLSEMMREETSEKEQFDSDFYIVDQLPACLPILKTIGGWFGRRRPQRILFYCHFPDQLLARRDEVNPIVRLLKNLYRYPFDWFEGWAMSAADGVVANSNFTREVVGEVFGRGRLGDIRIVYPCVHIESGKEEEDTGHGEELWGGKKVLLSINRFERKKGVELAIRAYHGLGEEGRRGTRLVIAGGYDTRVPENVQYHKELNRLAQDLGLQTATAKTVVSAQSIPDLIDVLFLLSVPTAFKETLLRTARLLLYTPVREHFGIVPVEAMQAGLPVLASNTGGPLETIVEGETGWLRDVDDVQAWTEVMRKVLWEMSEEDRARIAANGRRRARGKFSLDALGENLEKELARLRQAERKPFIGAQHVLGAGMVAGTVMAVVVAVLLVWL